MFVPGGDPGHTQPKYLMALLEKQTALLRKYHPKAQMWVSPQSFSAEWLDEFYAILKNEPAWLAGVVFGPQMRLASPKLRAAIPKRYPHPPLSRYHAQPAAASIPVPDWDVAFAVTRRPRSHQPAAARPGAHLPPAAAVHGRLHHLLGRLQRRCEQIRLERAGLGSGRDGSRRCFCASTAATSSATSFGDAFAQGLLALERNWRGPLLTNTGCGYRRSRSSSAMERDGHARGDS